MDKKIALCVNDMEKIASEGRMTLAAQVRAYDMLEVLLDCQDCSVNADAAARFHEVYDHNAAALSAAFSHDGLMDEAEALLVPLKEAMNEARFQAAASASLHEFAKEVFETWQNGGIFSRRRALRELRERAGFRLESHRIGNYVAKTFDLMNEAQARFARAQQALFSSDVRYKISEGVYARIADALRK